LRTDEGFAFARLDHGLLKLMKSGFQIIGMQGDALASSAPSYRARLASERLNSP
jgi:hypothetical protein